MAMEKRKVMGEGLGNLGSLVGYGGSEGSEGSGGLGGEVGEVGDLGGVGLGGAWGRRWGRGRVGAGRVEGDGDGGGEGEGEGGGAGAETAAVGVGSRGERGGWWRWLPGVGAVAGFDRADAGQLQGPSVGAPSRYRAAHRCSASPSINSSAATGPSRFSAERAASTTSLRIAYWPLDSPIDW